MKTKIICTLGPATESFNVLSKLKSQGMNLARINSAHGDFDQYQRFIKNSKKLGVPVILDLKGPDLRILLDSPLEVKKNQKIKFFKNKKPCFNYPILDDLKKNDLIFFDNGSIRSTIKEKNKDYVLIEFEEDAVILENKGVNIPGKDFKVPNLSNKDLKCLKLVNSFNVEFVALSFVRNKEDIIRLRKLTDALIISKIENSSGKENIKDIIKESDAIMIARGDLAVEIGKENVPFVQKDIIALCNEAGTPCIVATQMLESMINAKEPTRAEVSDVANAVIDGADAVMLSGETAIGKYPILVVREMTSLLSEADKHLKSKTYIEKNDSESLINVASELFKKLKIDKAVCLTTSGYTANMLARHRVNKEIVAITRTNKVFSLLNLTRGVTPVILVKSKTSSIKKLFDELIKRKILKKFDKILLLRNKKEHKQKITNAIELYDLKDF